MAQTGKEDRAEQQSGAQFVMPPRHCAKQVSYGTDDMGTMAAVPIQEPRLAPGNTRSARFMGCSSRSDQPAGGSKTILISVTW